MQFPNAHVDPGSGSVGTFNTGRPRCQLCVHGVHNVVYPDSWLCGCMCTLCVFVMHTQTKALALWVLHIEPNGFTLCR